MKNKVQISVLMAAMALSAESMAQTSATPSGSFSSTRESSAYSTRGITAEIKPLPSLLSVIPGVGVIDASVEGFVESNTAIYTEVSYLNSNVPDRLEGAAKDKIGGNKLYANKMRGGGIDIGARYYDNPMGHSWYTGGKVGYSEATAQWEYKDEVLDQTTATLTPGINAGYRWKFPSNFVVRLGAGAALNIVQKQEVKSDNNNADTDKARSDLDDAVQVPVIANIDLGLGYMF